MFRCRRRRVSPARNWFNTCVSLAGMALTRGGSGAEKRSPASLEACRTRAGFGIDRRRKKGFRCAILRTQPTVCSHGEQKLLNHSLSNPPTQKDSRTARASALRVEVYPCQPRPPTLTAVQLLYRKIIHPLWAHVQAHTPDLPTAAPSPRQTPPRPQRNPDEQKRWGRYLGRRGRPLDSSVPSSGGSRLLASPLLRDRAGAARSRQGPAPLPLPRRSAQGGR